MIEEVLRNLRNLHSDDIFECITTISEHGFCPSHHFTRNGAKLGVCLTNGFAEEVIHIELVKWADVFVIAPCSANTLAKISNGICDNLLTCCARAWDLNDWFKCLVVAPAMNTNMWSHPCTQEHLNRLRGWGIKVVEPVMKKLYCGDIGIGALAHLDDIFNELVLHSVKRDLFS